MTLLQTTNGWISSALTGENVFLQRKLADAQALNHEYQKEFGIIVWYALAVTMLVFYLWGKYTALKAARHEPGTVNLYNHVTRLGSAKPGGFQEEFERSMKAEPVSSWMP
jgi:hypothetical protein